MLVLEVILFTKHNVPRVKWLLGILDISVLLHICMHFDTKLRSNASRVIEHLSELSCPLDVFKLLIF